MKLTKVQEIGSALKNSKVGDTIRLEHAFTGDYVKSLILIAPTTAIITSRRNVGTTEFSYSICNQHDNKIERNRPDIIVEDKKEKSDTLHRYRMPI